MDKALKIQKAVIEILGTDEVYLVGGSVRDLVMGNEPKDYDFTTPMLPDEIEAAVEKAGRHSYGIGKKFGTIGFKVPVGVGAVRTDVVIKEDGKVVHKRVQKVDFEYVEVTTFRSEVYTSKSRKPEVAFVASLEEDLARRDFTMNAMVLRPDGTIYDPYGGKLHIHKKHIVTVGMPKDRIQEDPLRMLRAARFAARYGFTIDANFIGKARQLADRIYDVSVERWVLELDRLLTSAHAKRGCDELIAMGLFERILPELSGVVDFGSITEDSDQAWHDLLCNISKNQKINRYINVGICARLKFSNERTDIVLDNRKKKQVE